MPQVSEYFKLQKDQRELDFANVDVLGDNRLFVDPFALSQRLDPLSKTCHQTIVEFFTRVLEAIRIDQEDRALELLSHLSEPNETRLGYSQAEPRGAGIGNSQSRDILEALKGSSAVQTGFISSLEECELLIPGISRDKISDLTTNVIRLHLAEYTAQQCELLGIPVQSAPLPPVFDIGRNQWESRYHSLPLVQGQPLLLVPKVFVRFQSAYNHTKYYQHYVLNYLQAECLSAGSSLVKTLKNGKQVVYKTDLKPQYPCTKAFLYDFSQQHPDVLQKYRSDLAELERMGQAGIVSDAQETTIAEALSDALRSITSGSEHASTYHSLMVGVLELLFFPNLLSPKKEAEIHQGRKRIDIRMENGAITGIFSRLHQIRNIPCQSIVFECKNYSRDVANPELDQLLGRFAPRRGQVGFLCCRDFMDRPLFVQRCRDAYADNTVLAVPLDDDFFLRALAAVGAGARDDIDRMLTEAINEVTFS